MIQRLYIHNFRCLENFELPLANVSSVLLIGKNGAGKSTIGLALEILQSIGRGISRIGQLVQPKDFTLGRTDIPIRLEIEVLLDQKLYKYILALELPADFKELRICEEQLIVSGDPLYTRQQAQVILHAGARPHEAKFLVDWHLVALPLIQASDTDPLSRFKTWLAHIIILDPIPSSMIGDSTQKNLEPKRDASNFGEWLSGLLEEYPAAYTPVATYLQELMPDFEEFQNKPVGQDAKSMKIHFRDKESKTQMGAAFSDLSAGEKCFFLCAVLLASNKWYGSLGPLFCFWDEPDNYLSLSEVGHFIISLRRSFEEGGQIVMTSHNPEAIRKFSNENTWLIHRKSHLEPSQVRKLNDLSIQGDLVDALIRGDVEP